ncbi:MAG: GNAT family N-acetyltransferase [Pseudomonadota bacterium]
MSKRYCVPETYETKRLRLRRIALADAQSVFDSYAGDADVARYTSWTPHQTVGETHSFIKRVLSQAENGQCFPMIVFAKAALVQPIGVFEVNLHGSTADYGYVLSKTAWGLGYATEVLTSLIGHALSHPEIYRVEAFCNTQNTASAKVMKKAGMTREGAP